MRAKHTGGAAFPCVRQTDGNGELLTYESDGMTLRDYLAAKAMQAAFAGPGARVVADRDGRYDETNSAEVVALNAYEMADAMLKARTA